MKAKRILHVFDIACCICNTAYSEAINVSNINRGFERTCLWHPECLAPNIAALLYLIFNDENNGNFANLTLQFLVSSFPRRERSLLRDVGTINAGTLRICTTRETNLKHEEILGAFKAREARPKLAKKANVSENRASSREKMFIVRMLRTWEG